ncbi:MAG: hypothetical protein M1833_003871 [Piccolia ochrophora]|nr:MAG: hypothetical protein M1833_003871 [Piccolia ochrophora]
MNVDPHRERCRVSELDQSKLRRVSFSVDVEIAGNPLYTTDAGNGSVTSATPKEKDKKLKEKGEGEALKHPEKVQVEKEHDGVVRVSGEQVGKDSAPKDNSQSSEPPKEPQKEPQKEPSKKKEKKKKSEEERKQRKEKKRRQAEANGTVPIETTKNQDDSSSTHTPPESTTPKSQERPTIDPLRIYRRCCQLRETPVLKKITEQLTPKSEYQDFTSGVVPVLDLSGYWMQLADIVTLSDWLSIVPVRKLILDNCGLGDEAARSVLSALLAVRSPTRAACGQIPTISSGNEKGPTSHDIKAGNLQSGERHGVIEKLSLKNNPKIGREGWRHIGLFIHMSRSIKAVDLSMIPFPPTQSASNGEASLEKSLSGKALPADMSNIFAKAISERLAGSHLEELIMSECELTTEHLVNFINGVARCGVRRLGLADNNITREGLEHIVNYVQEGKCEGLDLGGNDLRNLMHLVVQVLDHRNPLYALCLADCNLTPSTLRTLLPALVALPNFRFIDLSHNPELFSSNPNALGLLRKYLPQMHTLKRIHLEAVSLTTEHVIYLAEILPEIKSLAHLSILANPTISKLVTATDEASQEETAALFAALMVAVRVSESIVCIDVDVPSQDNSEIVKALAKQVVAYCLRNMERGPVAEIDSAAAALTDPHGGEKEFHVPDVLLHIVGHVEGYPENSDNDEPAPDNDYVIGGTGVVRALGICLGDRGNDAHRASGDASAAESGTVTPKASLKGGALEKGRAKEMSKDLLGSARKIRARLRPALLREARGGSDLSHKRLLFLDQTLERMILRFEDEYPECRQVPPQPTRPPPPPLPLETSSTSSDFELHSRIPSHDDEGIDTSASADEDDDAATLSPPFRSSFPNENVLRAQAHEEGRMHRFGQQVRRDILAPPVPAANTPARTSQDPDHLTRVRERLDAMPGAEVKEVMDQKGVGGDEIWKALGINAEELGGLKKDDPEGFEKFRQSQIAAMRNASVDAGYVDDAAAVDDEVDATR